MCYYFMIAYCSCNLSAVYSRAVIPKLGAMSPWGDIWQNVGGHKLGLCTGKTKGVERVEPVGVVLTGSAQVCAMPCFLTHE